MRLPDFNKAFPTLFLPIVVPNQLSEDENDAVVDCFRAFMDAAAVSDPIGGSFLFQETGSPVVEQVLEKMRSMSKVFCDLHGAGVEGLSPSLIHSNLKGLRPGGYWGMWVPAQNGVLLLHRPESNDGKQDVVRVYVWEAQAPNSEVMQNDAPVRQACPRSATNAPWERFLHLATAQLLSELATTTCEKAIPNSRKSGKEFDETRDVVKPMYLTEYFLAALGGEAIPTKTIKGVHKSMRDNVIYSGGKLPWRRAPVWAALKSLLHVVCVMETTKETGHIADSQVIYKVVLQNFLAFCLEKTNVISSSAIVESSRKIARRAAKIERLYKNIWKDCRFLQASNSFCAKIVSEKMKYCVDEWRHRCEKPVKCEIDVQKIKPENDVVHQLKSSLPVLTKLVQLGEAFYQLDVKCDIPEPPGRVLLANREMSCKLLEDHIIEIKKTFKCWKMEPQDAIGQLHDVAISLSKLFMDIFMDIRDKMNPEHIFLTNKDKADDLASPLMRLLDSYTTIGLKMYSKDPRGCGEIILVSLAMVLVLDMLACNHHPNLKEHRLGIDPEFLESILVSNVENKKLLFQLESYMNGRNAHSSYPTSSIEQGRSSNSLSVRFARSNPEMKATLESIQKRCESNQESKKLEHQRKLKRHADLQTKICSEGSCSCYGYYNSNGSRRIVKCRRCILVKEAKNIRIRCYEKLLPPNPTQQLAVVYELKQPELLACQRNAILFLNENLCCEDWWDNSNQYLWSKESRLNDWKTRFDGPPNICELGSTRKKFSSSHYNKEYHAEKRESFIVEHDYLTQLMGPIGMVKETLNWKLKPVLCCVKLKDESRYKSLETFVNSFSHSENDIIAAKSTASEELSLTEFEKVGMLRAGPRLQLIRLSSSLVQKDISLEREEIVPLVQYTLWQAGPPCSLNQILQKLNVMQQNPNLTSWYRQQSEILRDATFVENLCDLLHLIIDGCKSNWSNQNILLNITYIAMHLFEHSNTSYSKNDVANIVDVITKCRNLAKQWIGELTAAFTEAIDDVDRQSKRGAIAYVAAIGTFTYSDSDDLLFTSDDIGLWIFFRTLFNANFAPVDISQGSDCRSHFFHAFAVAETVEPRLHRLLSQDKSGLDKFLDMYFSFYGENARDWKQCVSRHWFHSRGDNDNIVQVDIIGGDLLVNGSPPTNIPRSITSHEIFFRLFDKSIFMVTPTDNFGFRTASKVDGFFYEFYPPHGEQFDKAPIILKECDNLRAILIPWKNFVGDLPEQLVNEYSHWFVLKAPNDETIRKDCVYFCPKSYKRSKQRHNIHDLEDSYILDCDERLVFEKESDQKLIDIQSKTFEELYFKVFSRLSSKSRIHASVSSNIRDPVMIKIPVLQNMRFIFDQESSVIWSNDYRGLRVSKDQLFGSLIGIRHGLLLEGDNDCKNKVYLCPHGRVCRSNDGSININIDEIRSPPFFRFEVRPELKDLRPCTKNKIASFFLAHLHAATSGILPDPFTGTTGTQRVITILRSGHCSGNLLNSVEEKNIKKPIVDGVRALCEIACISNKRREYHSMEINNSNSSGYDALCATPAFSFLVKLSLKDLKDALKVIGKDEKSMPYLAENQKEDIGSRSSPLSRRAYFQHREKCPKDSCLNKKEEQQIFGASEMKGKSLALPCYFGRPVFKLAQDIGFESQNKCYKQLKAGCLLSLLCSRNFNTLQGITGTAVLTGGPMQCFASLCDPLSIDASNGVAFRNIWLNLYHICQTQIDNRDKETSLSFLLTWLMIEYPESATFLQQLSIIATYPNEFPTAPDILKYDNPHEKNYSCKCINTEIEGHLYTFTEPEPDHEYDRNQWSQRKKRHQEKRRDEARMIEYKIRCQWGNRDAQMSISEFSLLTSTHSFENKIKQLFKRWREAEILHNFIEKLTKRLDDIAKRLKALHVEENILIPLDCDGTVDIRISREIFNLSTSPNFDILIWDKDSGVELSNIEPYTLSLNTLSVDQMRHIEVKQISFLNKSNFVNVNLKYEEVWNALVRPLRNSLQLACHEPDNFTSDFDLLRSGIKMQLRKYAERATSVYTKMYNRISGLLGPETGNAPFLKIQKNVFLWDSVGPFDLLLQCSKESTSDAIKNELLSLSISIKHIQRARRCLRILIDRSEGLRMHLLNDLSIKFSNLRPGLNEFWNAYEYPEFIMFEVDNDIAIRDTQVEVACEILKERSQVVSTNNRLMQLNMGEGKTAVIMPIVLAHAARGDKIVRATVLASLYSTNASDWQYKLGGLLNRRIYPMLCRRDIPICTDGAEMMLKLCQNIKEERHIIVTIPEHRLSLENKAIELASDLTMAKDLAISKTLHEVVNFLWGQGREFLDESDEILSSKYQLTYTIGAPRDMEGAQLRWEIHSSIYGSLTRHASSLLEVFGKDVIELGTRERETEYIGLRLLEGSKGCDKAYNEIKKCIIDDILNNRSNLKITLRKKERQIWERCVCGRGNTDDLDCLPDSSKVIALCLRGMLEHDVLKIVLFKRWRVHYGNHPTRKGFNMAVPYRAKDTAAERTEYGHPDVALSLTFAHYFQAGLQEKEVRDVFERLKRMSDSDAKAEYSNWVGSGRMAEEMEGFASYEGVNTEDSNFFKTKLVPVFKKNMRVIRFWLVKIVLPVQAKQFPKKLTSTAPELCRNSQLGKFWTAVTTGFSGTDDLSLLLPPTIVQENLQSLKKTNGVQLKNILREENNYYSYLVDEDTTEELLTKVLTRKPDTSNINVVLDAGALVLHKSNRDFVESWLHIRKDMEAAAYFEGSVIFVLTQDGALLKFDASLYCEDMSKCLLYLDDIHTRGSDFCLPFNTRAVLTLGKGLPKDKFVQACMRMRQLGRGQSLIFVASREVNRVLENDFCLNTCGNMKLGFVSTILDWTISNSVKRICELMPYFVDQMRSTIQKAYAYNKFFTNPNTASLDTIANECMQDEILELLKLYGHKFGDELLTTIVDHSLNTQTLFGITSKPASMEVDDSRRSIVELITEIKERVRRLAPHIRVPCTMLDEEQERELEQELEEEIDVERPPPAVPLKPHFSKGLNEVLRKGQNQPDLFLTLCELNLLPLNAMFSGTSFSESRIGSQLKSQVVFVTKDFVDTVKGKMGKDCFVKNIRWFLKFGSAPDLPHLPVIVVSNFEAEALSNLLASTIRNHFVPEAQFPSLYAFTPITRLQQPRIFLTNSSCEPPVVLHVFAGSVHADEELTEEISSFLSIFPRPLTVTGMKMWDDLFERDFIERDGFVLPNHRDYVGEKSSFDGSKKGLFRASPVENLQRFYGDCRHLNSELPNSSIGRLLGVSELISKYDEDESEENDEVER